MKVTKVLKLTIRSTLLGTLTLLAACSSGLEQPLPDLAVQETSTTLNIPVISASDDAEEIQGGAMQLTGGLLDLRAKDGVLQTVGVRFQKVAIPRGATVESAYFTVKGGAADSGSVTLSVRGEAADNASTFSTATNNLSSRSKTSAAVTWQPNSWVGGGAYQTGNLAAILQEIVSRSGWQSGNALTLFISGVAGSAERTAIAYGSDLSKVPVLKVTFRGGTVTPPTSEPAPPTEPTPTEPTAPEQPTEPTPITPTEPTQPTEPTPTDPTPEPTDPGSVSSNQKVWLERLRSSLDSGRYRITTQQNELNLDYIADSANAFFNSRNGNMVATSYVLAYRETGDRKLMDYVNTYMLRVKAQLRDHNGDGFRDMLLHHPGDAYHNKDTGHNEEMLLHGSLGGLTLALKQAGYSSTASWFTSYFKNDFLAKWASRGYPAGPRHPLTHPNANFMRFQYAMYKLTGESKYLSTARSMASTLKKTIRSDGWSHYFGRTSGNCQPSVYVPLTSIAMADLATNGSGLVDTATMQRAAQTVATRVMKNSNGTSLAGNSCGSGTYGGLGSIATFTYTPIGAWDSSGRIEAISERVYNATERYNLNSPIRTVLPASLAFTKGR